MIEDFRLLFQSRWGKSTSQSNRDIAYHKTGQCQYGFILSNQEAIHKRLQSRDGIFIR